MPYFKLSWTFTCQCFFIQFQLQPSKNKDYTKLLNNFCREGQKYQLILMSTPNKQIYNTYILNRMISNKLTDLFLSKLSHLIQICEALYWNQLGTGFIIVDFTKLEQQLVQRWQHHLRTFLKKLKIYGFNRRKLFEGIEFTHLQLQDKKKINISYIKQEDVSLQQKMRQQQLINSRLLILTRNINLHHRQQQQGIRKTKKNCSNSMKILNKLTFQVITGGKNINKMDIKNGIKRLRNNLQASKQQLQISSRRLQESLGLQKSMNTLIRQPVQKLQISPSVAYSQTKIQSQL